MKLEKFSTILMVIIMIFSISVLVGCGKENNNNTKKEPEQADSGNKKEDDEEESKNEESEEKKVVLLKRNGVEWKENSTIKSKRGAQKYTVVWGDTLSLIARSWNVNTYTLARYNGIKNIDIIEVGQVIYNYTYKSSN